MNGHDLTTPYTPLESPSPSPSINDGQEDQFAVSNNSTDIAVIQTLTTPRDPVTGELIFIQYPVRWLVLFIFALLTITNAVLWIQFAPIQDLTASYYGVSNTWVNGLSMSFMVLYLPGYFLAFWAMDTYGLKTGLIIASVGQTIGAWIRYMSIIGATDNSAHEIGAFSMLMVGQCLAGLMQPMFTNAPAKMSSDWFSVSQRNLATTIAAMSNPIGIAVGQVLPTSLVDDNGGMPTLLLVTACFSTATCLMCLLIRRAPLTPPSRSTMDRNLAKLAAEEEAHQHPQGFWQGPLIQELRLLLTNKHFLILLFGVGIGLGLFNAVTTLIEQLVKPSGYDKDDAGNFGALLIVCGLIGAGIIGPVMDATHAYTRILKGGLFAAFSGTVFMLMCLRPGHFALVCVSFGVLGMVMVPLLPVCMECAAECTYPVSEDASSGLMLFGGNFVGIIMIVAVGDLIPSTYSTVFNPASITLVCFLALAVIVVGLTYDGPLRRQEAEKLKTVTTTDEEATEQQDPASISLHGSSSPSSPTSPTDA